MNLIHGFNSTNSLINPDMRLLQQNSIARTLKELFVCEWSQATVGKLYDLKAHAQATSDQQWDSLAAYFDDLVTLGKKNRETVCYQYQFLTYFSDFVYLVEKHDIHASTRITDLILDDSQYIEAETHERQIHHAINFATLYGNEF